MAAEFFGKELDVNQVVTPLIAAPELCFYECSGMDDEHDVACRDAVLTPGSVYVIGCAYYNPVACNAQRHHVGSIDRNGSFQPNSGYHIDRVVNESIAANLGIKSTDLQDFSDEKSGLRSLSQALVEFDLRLLQEHE